MSRLAHDRNFDTPCEPREKLPRNTWPEMSLRRQLQQQYRELRSQTQHAIDKLVELGRRAAQSRVVGECPGNFHREAEINRGGIRPALVSRAPVQAVERGVDLNTVEVLRVVLQVGAPRLTVLLLVARVRPARGPDADHPSRATQWRRGTRITGRGHRHFAIHSALVDELCSIQRLAAKSDRADMCRGSLPDTACAAEYHDRGESCACRGSHANRPGPGQYTPFS